MTFHDTARIFGLAFLLANGMAQTPNVSRPATFSTASRLVLVPFTVTDHNGKTVLDLQAKDFGIFDDRTEQRIVSFAYEDAPCTVGLVLDISGSMKSMLGLVKDGAHSFLKTANPE